MATLHSQIRRERSRPCYDGISYAAVTPFQFAITNVSYNPNAQAATLTWNSIPRQSLLLPQKFTVLKKTSLNALDWTVVATGVVASGSATAFTDHVGDPNSAFYRITMP